MNRQLVAIAIGYLVAAWVLDWWPFDPLDSEDLLPLSEYENVTVNAFFYTPAGEEVFLGQMKGASACGDAAHSYAVYSDLSEQNWDYICCTVRLDSECYETIR